MAYKTEQENFWSGEFGDDYVERNKSQHQLAGNLYFFSKILSRCEKIKSIIEFGPNIGMNLKAIRSLVPNIECTGVEINHKAASMLKNDVFYTEGGVYQYM